MTVGAEFDFRVHSFVPHEPQELYFEIAHEKGLACHNGEVDVTDLFVALVFEDDNEVSIDNGLRIIVFI